ncbi:MAG TPA: ABC transporter permease [Saprospiraceae bacterium]|nr:ABC transporter permease [Saprospiraceae bacterium]
MTHLSFNIRRLTAIMVKEFIQMRRDRVTFGMMVGVPILQLILFGFAINSDPRHLPLAVMTSDPDIFSRSIEQALQHSEYFELVGGVESEADVESLFRSGRAQFVLHIPPKFSRDLLRGDRPSLLLEADATDPSAMGGALSALSAMTSEVLARDLRGPFRDLLQDPAPFEWIVHRRYNPEIITQYNIVPGLIGVVLTMTMVLITGLAITRERERGTMENLLSTPAHAGEVIVGKIIPYILVGYIQAGLVLAAAHLVFRVPLEGSILLLLSVMLIFIIANLAVGITFSTIATNQLQSMQMAFFFFLPSILMSGFMFPFRGMPHWAQWIGEMLPLTHFLRIVRGILLKGNGFPDILPEMVPLFIFMTAVLALGIVRYRQTLD